MESSSFDFESFGVIERLHAESIRRGVPFLAVMTPNEVHLITDRFDAIGGRVTRFCATKGIPFADPLPVLRANPERVDPFHDGQRLSAPGNRVPAEWLAPIIEAALREDRPVSWTFRDARVPPPSRALRLPALPAGPGSRGSMRGGSPWTTRQRALTSARTAP